MSFASKGSHEDEPFRENRRDDKREKEDDVVRSPMPSPMASAKTRARETQAFVSTPSRPSPHPPHTVGYTIDPFVVNQKTHMWGLTRTHHAIRQQSFATVADAVTAIDGALTSRSEASLMSEVEVGEKVMAPELCHNETIWIDVKGATRAEMATIAEACRLSDLTLEDLTTGDTPDKIECVGGYFFCVLSFERRGEHGRVAIVMMDRLILTVHQDATWVVMEAMARLHAMRVNVLTSESVFYAMLDVVIDCIAHRVRQFQDEVDAVDEIVLMITERDRSDTLVRLTTTRRMVGHMRASTSIKESIVKTVLSHQYARCFVLRQNYHDVLDNLTQALARIEQARDVISQANNNIVSILSMRSAEHANQTNDVMKRLTMVGSALLPLNLLSSTFGMNVRVPWRDDENTDAFWFLVAGMMGFIFCVYAAYRVSERRRKRLEEKAENKKHEDL